MTMATAPAANGTATMRPVSNKEYVV